MKIFTKSITTLCLLLVALVPVTAFSADDSNGQSKSLNDQVQDLKHEVLQLNRDLFMLEEDLLFPANTQFSVFVSVNAGKLFSLDSVQLKVDGKPVANHLYTERQLDALKRGGVQRLYIGNIASGEHELVALVTGKGPSQRDYRRGATLNFDKSTDPMAIELKIDDNGSKEQPEFNFKVWE